MASSEILIVEDEIKLAELLSDYLKAEGFTPTMLHRGDEVEDYFKSHQVDLILLDLMLPGVDGLTICKQIRETSNVPIIMVTARVEEIDRLLGLEFGADDYICKPYSPREVIARVKAVLRRAQPVNATMDESIQLDAAGYKVSHQGKNIELTKVEFLLFQTLFNRPGQIFSRSQLMDTIYDDQHVVSDRTIDSHIKKLRKKLQEIGIEEGAIYSVYGAGYKFE